MDKMSRSSPKLRKVSFPSPRSGSTTPRSSPLATDFL
jgi:hypothetical protein